MNQFIKVAVAFTIINNEFHFELDDGTTLVAPAHDNIVNGYADDETRTGFIAVNCDFRERSNNGAYGIIEVPTTIFAAAVIDALVDVLSRRGTGLRRVTVRDDRNYVVAQLYKETDSTFWFWNGSENHKSLTKKDVQYLMERNLCEGYSVTINRN